MSTSFQPHIPRPYGSDKEIVSRAIAQLGTPKSIAHKIGRRASVVHAYTDPNHPTHIGYDKVRKLTEEGATAFVEDLCHLAGGAFLPGEPGEGGLELRAGRSVVQVSEFVSELLLALQDRVISEREQTVLLERIDACLRHLIECRRHVTQKKAGA